MPLILFLYCNINYNSIMEDSNNPVVKTTEANLREAKQAIESIEAQLLEVKACIRSIEAVQHPPEQLRALARKFFVMGAEAQQEAVRGRDIDPYIYLDGNADGLRWSFEGNVNIEADYWVDEVEFDNVVITDEDIDEVINNSPGGNTAQ